MARRCHCQLTNIAAYVQTNKRPDERPSPVVILAPCRAFLGHGWLGCSRTYVVPEQINWDYGIPQGLCKETAPDSGVFTREWTKASIKMDCNTWTPTITLK